MLKGQGFNQKTKIAHSLRNVCTFLRTLTAAIEAEQGINAMERNALKQGVGQFQRESIGQAGRRLDTKARYNQANSADAKSRAAD